MKAEYGLTKSSRKGLVKAVEQITGTPAKYLGAPSMAYQIGRYQVGRNGELTAPGDESGIVEELRAIGFEPIGFEKPETVENHEENTSVRVARKELPDNKLENLRKIVEAKGALIKMALGTGELPIEVTENEVILEWLKGTDDSDAHVYRDFIGRLVKMAEARTRIASKPDESDLANPKYAFRCFLLRLGYIGSEYREERKALMKRLPGNAAWKKTQESEG